MSEPAVARTERFVLRHEEMWHGDVMSISYSILRVTTDDPQAETNVEQVCWCAVKADAELILTALQLAEQIEPLRVMLPVKLPPWPPIQEADHASP